MNSSTDRLASPEPGRCGTSSTSRRESASCSQPRTRYQRVERAFAAEILAPAVGVEEMLGATSYVYFDELERVANHFDVSTRVIRHQAENQLALDVIE